MNNPGSYSPLTDPPGPSSGDFLVLRGGSWLDISYGMRVSSRGGSAPANAVDAFGFRCAQD
ncbi:MAG: SUMF1/EgtB/PvdO family nonheme iron enzyme [bacterium]